MGCWAFFSSANVPPVYAPQSILTRMAILCNKRGGRDVDPFDDVVSPSVSLPSIASSQQTRLVGPAAESSDDSEEICSGLYHTFVGAAHNASHHAYECHMWRQPCVLLIRLVWRQTSIAMPPLAKRRAKDHSLYISDAQAASPVPLCAGRSPSLHKTRQRTRVSAANRPLTLVSARSVSWTWTVWLPTTVDPDM